MRGRPALIANWKMNFTAAEAAIYARRLAQDLRPYRGVDIVLCPDFLGLAGVKDGVAGTEILVGAQDAHWADRGAYTGQIGARMLRGLADYVILGHSETRAELGIDDQKVRRKLAAVLANGLRAIVAIGETNRQYLAGQSQAILSAQVENVLLETKTSELERVIIAYEPIWAIGSGRTPEADYVNQLVKDAIRAPLSARFGARAGRETRVIYGGSVNTANFADFIAQPALNGALVGGASLDRDQFIQLASIAQAGVAVSA